MNISPGTGTRLLFKRRCADLDLRPLVFRGSARLGSEPKVLAETKSACASWHRFGIMTEIGEIGSGNIRKVKGLDGAHSLDREPFWPLLSTQAQRPVVDDLNPTSHHSRHSHKAAFYLAPGLRAG